jgi:hypothetical protein
MQCDDATTAFRILQASRDRTPAADQNPDVHRELLRPAMGFAQRGAGPVHGASRPVRSRSGVDRRLRLGRSARHRRAHYDAGVRPPAQAADARGDGVRAVRHGWIRPHADQFYMSPGSSSNDPNFIRLDIRREAFVEVFWPGWRERILGIAGTFESAGHLHIAEPCGTRSWRGSRTRSAPSWSGVRTARCPARRPRRPRPSTWGSTCRERLRSPGTRKDF